MNGFLGRFSLLHDKAADAEVDASLRAGAELSGSTPWILMFAILVASVGLNVNSTAVVIGAMLISPLMGPIMGVGYGVGIYDFELIRKSLTSLAVGTIISLSTSTLYFLVSPLAEAQSELLARTSPTIWDLLIALFGGLAGIVGATRKEKSNVIPGVAIATALMPPLCTAGYGLASGNLRFFAGAFYLFTINSVFIALGTVVVTSLLGLPHKQFVDPETEKRVRRVLLTVVLVAALPSIYLTRNLLVNELFSSKARQFLRREFNLPKSHMTEVQISPDSRRVEVSLIGEPVPVSVLKSIEERLAPSGLEGASLVVHQGGANGIDVGVLRAGIVKDLYREGLRTSDLKDEEIARLRTDLSAIGLARERLLAIAAELNAQYPQLEDVVVAQGSLGSSEKSAPDRSILIASARSARSLARADRKRIEDWLAVRAKVDSVRLSVEVGPARAGASTPPARPG